MKHFDTIRGKKPTKTELILEYLLNHPRKVVSPKEVAEGLGFNLQTTVTVLNRLALEGAISKRARGLFCYDQEVKFSDKEEVDTEEEKIQSCKIDKKTGATIYKAIYNMASESAGSEIIATATDLNLSDFDENAPVESIQKLVRALIDVLGQDMVHDIVNIALENELTSEKIPELIDILT